MNTGDACPKCTKATWLYDTSTLTCKDGHHTPIAVPLSRPLVVVSRRQVPSFAWALAGAIAAVVIDRI